MRRKLLTILAAIIALGPLLSVLYAASVRWGQPVLNYLHSAWATISIISGYIALILVLDHVLQKSRRPLQGVCLCGGTAAVCGAGLLSLWIMWLTSLRPVFLIVNGLTVAGLFCLLYFCRRRLELTVLGLVFAIGGLALYGVALQEAYTIAGMTAWAKTEGTITRNSVSGSRDNKFRTRELAYEYMVDGQRYVGSEDSWRSSGLRCGWRENLWQVWPAYGGREKVVVYYDPSEPQKAILRPGLSYATAFVLKASLLSVLGGMALLVASAQLRRSQGIGGGRERAPSPVEAMTGGGLRPHWPAPTAFAILGTCVFLAATRIQPISVDAMRVPRIGRGPTTAAQFRERGFQRLREHEPERAVNNFTRALQLDPDNADLYCMRGYVQVQAGHVAEAVEDWRKAIQLDWQMAFPVYHACRIRGLADPQLDQIIAKMAQDHLGDLETVSGYAVGYAGEPGEFYTASLILSARLSEGDFLRMSRNEKPVVRAMALICLARRDMARHQATIRSFYNDTAEVMYMPIGCGASPISLGALAKRIVEDPNTLRYWDPKRAR